MSDDIIVIDHKSGESRKPDEFRRNKYAHSMIEAGMDPTKPVPIEAMKEPLWEFQPEVGEIEDAYKQFLIYASFPPTERTIQKAWEIWSQGTTQRSHNISSHFNRYQWAPRASAWDIYKLKTVQNDWITREEKRREEDFAMGDLLRMIARDNLERLHHSGAEITANQAARFAELASELQHKAIPSAKLDAQEIKELMNALPEERRKRVVGILIAKSE